MSLFHTSVSILALILGGIVYFFPKGTRIHSRIGIGYSISMFLCIFTSFFIYDMFDGFGPFHFMSIIALTTLSIGLWFPIFGRSNSFWPIHHYFWMSYSYIGLWMALFSHFWHVIEHLHPFLAAFILWGLPYILGSIVLFANKQKMIDSYLPKSA